jgi:hypothetical protein
MTLLKNYVCPAACVFAIFIIHLNTSYSQSDFSEQTLTSDMLIEDNYQPGSGLPVGKIQSVWGEALVFHRDPTVGYRIQTGLPIYAGDIIRTRVPAWIQFRLMDGSLIILAPDTTLTIRKSICSSARKTCDSILYLPKGDAHFKLKPPADLSSYQFRVQTDLASASAGEADFIVNAIAGAASFIALEKSRMEIASLSQPEEITFLSDFQKTVFSDKIISPAVEAISMEAIETVLAEFYPAPPSGLFADDSEVGQVSENPGSELPGE